MRFKSVMLLIISILISSCGGDSPSEPDTSNDSVRGFIRATVQSSVWYTNKVTANQDRTTLVIVGLNADSTGTTVKNSRLEFRLLNFKNPGLFGIGEDTPGIKYAVKAYYKTFTVGANDTVYYAAEYDNYSLMDVSTYSEKSLEADFLFRAFNSDSSKTINFTSGKLDLNF
ncbi:MAG: hypothetical protein K9J12_02300 [Melioribacteraceae bacterium]|nr:hypothetical protein [Melioribacteraceae bacterium]MCF8263860.1 hypothetical protein [Melioribacteraceae bacterium]MCF8413944.1 hypothetical protein [Melioribacteraceae bacterium]